MVDRKLIGYNPEKPLSLASPIKKSSKYSHVGPSIDTGLNSTNIKTMSDRAIIHRKGETFKRIKVSTVAYYLRKKSGLLTNESILETSKSQSPRRFMEPKMSVHSLLKHDIYNLPKQSGLTSPRLEFEFNAETEFVIVDLREPEDYKLYHVKGAISFPGPGVTQDRIPSQIMNFKNKLSKFVIVYHSDEKHGIPYAAHMAEKGFTNVFLVTGGIDEFLYDAPDLLEGKKVPFLQRKKMGSESVVWKRSKYLEYPDESDVIIPNNNFSEENNKSIFSNSPIIGVKKSLDNSPQVKFKNSPPVTFKRGS